MAIGDLLGDWLRPVIEDCAHQPLNRSIDNPDSSNKSPIINLQSTTNQRSKINNHQCSIAVAVLCAATATACVRPALPQAPRPEAQVLFVVVTWNVHSGRADLPRFIDDLRQGRLTGAPVRDYAILLQETIEGNQYDAVKAARERQLYAYFTKVRDSKQGISGNAIVSTAMPLTARTIVLPHIRRMRKAIVASFEIEGQPLFVVDAHLENRTSWLQGALFSERARKEQAEALLRELPPGPGILGGDLNTWLGTDEDALKALGRRFDNPPDHASVPTFADRLVLDHLFFDLPPGWTASRQVVADRYGSDHHPVIGLIIADGRAS
jgi:endonuclease/exonuclease/phosphatase family metal-dependent hydrolase